MMKIPILDWLPKYKIEYFKGDLFAGITVGIILIPQGMAYAMIAGLPPVYGLYAAIMPQLVYAIFGTSRQLAVGPVAMDSLLVAVSVSTLAEAGSEHYIALSLLLAFMMGVIQLILGLVRMGFLVNFLSKPVISGFTSAAAIIIGLNQVKYLLGIDILRNSSVFSIIQQSFNQIEKINIYALAIGLGGVILIKTLKKIHKGIPSALVIVVLGILITYFLRLDKQSVQIIGLIPSGLPHFQVPSFSFEILKKLLPAALTLAFIAFMESISVAKSIEVMHQGEYKIKPSQELIALGLGNIIGSLFMSYPTTGGFSRSAVNHQSGANTNLSAFVAAALIAMTLLFLTSIFFYLPKAILASIIMVAVFGLIDFNFVKYLWKIQKQDFWMLVATFVITLVFGIKEGILAGVFLSLGLLIYRTTRPHVAVLGKIDSSGDYRNINRFVEASTREDILIIRYDSQLYFANAIHFVESLEKLSEEKGDKLKLIILNAESVSFMDTSALEELKKLVSTLNKKGIQLYFMGLIGPVRDFLSKSDFVDEVGQDCFFTEVQQAIDYYDQKPEASKKINFSIATQSNAFKEKEV